MKIAPFKVEEWMNEYEDGAKYNIAETCVNSISLDELFTLCGEDKESFLNALCAKRLTYGEITGIPEFKQGIAKLYKSINPEEVVITHGAAGANHHVFYSLVEKGDRVISIMPTYQQLYSIPESFGADVQLLNLDMKDGYLPDLEQLRRLAIPGTKLICINNPNNPTGALINPEMMLEIVEIARSCGAYILCDEVYRHLTQDDIWQESIVDMYEKGISVSSMSKVFSMAGLRLGWIASHDTDFLKSCMSHRDYNHISCGMFDEAVAALALKNSDKILARNRIIVRENLAVLDAWVQSEPRVEYVKPQAGTTALVYYKADIPSYDFCKDMYFKTGAFVTPGACFEQEHCMRIGYACEKETLIAGLKAIGEYLDEKVHC